jgi:hypothetical protein
MQKSEQIDQLAIALAKVQATMGTAVKDSDNPFFRSKYADLTSVWDAFSGPLAANGLSITQVGEDAPPGHIALTTMLIHSSGQWIAGTLTTKLVKDDPQGYGSGMTYLRRYGVAAIVGVRTEDDDGAAASDTVVKTEKEFTKPVSAAAARYRT